MANFTIQDDLFPELVECLRLMYEGVSNNNSKKKGKCCPKLYIAMQRTKPVLDRAKSLLLINK